MTSLQLDYKKCYLFFHVPFIQKLHLTLLAYLTLTLPSRHPMCHLFLWNTPLLLTNWAIWPCMFSHRFFINGNPTTCYTVYSRFQLPLLALTQTWFILCLVQAHTHRTSPVPLRKCWTETLWLESNFIPPTELESQWEKRMRLNPLKCIWHKALTWSWFSGPELTLSHRNPQESDTPSSSFCVALLRTEVLGQLSWYLPVRGTDCLHKAHGVCILSASLTSRKHMPEAPGTQSTTSQLTSPEGV